MTVQPFPSGQLKQEDSSISIENPKAVMPLSSSSDGDGDGDGDSSSHQHQPTPISLPQHEWNELMQEEEFSENSEDLFKVAHHTANDGGKRGNDDSSAWTSYNDSDDNRSWIPEDEDSSDEQESSWVVSKNQDSNDEQPSISSPISTPPTNTAKRKKANGPFVWVFREGIDALEQAARLVLPLSEEDDHEEKQVEIQWNKNRAFEWVSREDIRTVQEGAASFHSRGSSYVPSVHSRGSSSVAPSFHSRDGSSSQVAASHHSRGSLNEDLMILPATFSPSNSPNPNDPLSPLSTDNPSRGEMMKQFRHSEISQSGRRIMRIQNNIITSDSSESSSSSDGTLEDEEPTPSRIRGKIGNMLDASKIKVPFRNNSHSKRSSHSHSPKPDQESASSTTTGPTHPLRKRSLSGFPLASPLRRSSSLGKKSSMPPSFNEDDDLDGGKLKSNSFHHDQRRARKGIIKKAFKSKSADSQPAKLGESTVIVQAKKLSNSGHNPRSQQQQQKESMQKSSSFHHEQRSQQRKSDGGRVAVKSRSADSQPAELFSSPTITEAKTLWAEMHASSPQLTFSSPNAKQLENKEDIPQTPSTSDAKTLWAEMYASSPQLMFSPETAKKSKRRSSENGGPISEKVDFHASSPEIFAFSPSSKPSNFHIDERSSSSDLKSSSFHHEQRKQRRGGKKKAFKSRSADSQPVEWRESEIMSEGTSSLSNSMHNLIKPESMSKPKNNSSHHDQRKARAEKSKQQKSRSADSVPPGSEARIEQLRQPLSTSMHSPGTFGRLRHQEPRRKNSLKKNKLSPLSNHRGSGHRHSAASMPSADGNLLKSPQSSRNRVRKSDPGINLASDHSNPIRNTSLRRSEGEVMTMVPKRSSSNTASPKRNSSTQRKDMVENSGITYLQRKKNQHQQQEDSSSKRPGATLSMSPKRNDGRAAAMTRMKANSSSNRSLNNVDSRIAVMKKSSSHRKLERADSNRSINNVDSRIALMKKSSSHRKLEDSLKGSSHRKLISKDDSQRRLKGATSKAQKSNEDAAALAILKTKRNKTPQGQSFARKLLSDDAPVPSPISSPIARFSKSSDNLGLDKPTDLNDSFVARAEKLQISPGQGTNTRASLKSKLEALNDRMSMTIGVEASPGVIGRKRGSTLQEKRLASRESRKNLTNAFQRMIQPNSVDIDDRTANEDLEVPMNN